MSVGEQGPMKNPENEDTPTIVELVAPNGLGFGEGGISVKSQIDQGILTPDTPRHIHEFLMNDPEAFKFVEVDDDGCGDGRPWTKVVQEYTDKNGKKKIHLYRSGEIVPKHHSLEILMRIVHHLASHTISELKVGQSVDFAIKAKATKPSLTGIKNTACVDAEEITGTPDDCDSATIATPPVPPVDNDITVCEVDSKTILTIKESAFDEAKHSKDLSKCAETPTPEVPEELPTTGLSDGITAFVGLGALALSTTYYVVSRRLLGNL